MTVGELARRSGVPASTIRYWERIGLLPAPPRVSGQRRYTSVAMDRLATLRLAQACGFRLDEVRDLMQGFDPATPPSARWQAMAGSKRHEIEAQMERLREMRRLVDRVMDCQCKEMTDCGRATESGR